MYSHRTSCLEVVRQRKRKRERKTNMKDVQMRYTIEMNRKERKRIGKKDEKKVEKSRKKGIVG